jgi:hypothetical protein
VKSKTRYELAFALDHPMTESVFAAASDRLSRKDTIERIGDYYYEKQEESQDAKAKWAGRNQYRIRHLNVAGESYLERLRWDVDACSLRRTAVLANELPMLAAKDTNETWSGKWFCKRIAKHRLIPALQTYLERTTWTYDASDGVDRLTLDENIQSQCLRKRTKTSPQTLPCSVLRMNFGDAMPAAFKSLIYQFALIPKQPTVVVDLAHAQAAGNQQSTPVHATYIQSEAVECLLG